MRLFLTLLIFISIAFSASAQKTWKYKIKIVEHNGKRHSGFFYAAEDKQLIIIKSNGDTSRLKAENIGRFYIHKRGIVAPFAIAGALTFLILSVESENALEAAVLIIVGIPIGVSLGLITGELFANKRYYKKLEAKDFPIIKADLKKYTQLK
ncbi:hypothetical protein [Pedobacter mucosus]|uniref:hypothetical protein n=1 Tax=Pedobacter mucosus TaxID=2895286 RepID=UPI001EE4DE41|nr:hypothetical protein [Pedobacter mucosus]UKT64580.1 hypothetical protein LOK61_02100 [Pedobacter mucosus]